MADRGATRSPAQQVRFCRAADGVRLAYAVHGSGPPLVLASCWLSHLQYDWHSPVWRHFLEQLGKIATVIRYDERGYGLSDWQVEDFSLEARVADLELIVDAAGLDRFALMGMSQGGPVAITYATRHAERVSQLILYGSYATPLRDATPETREITEMFLQLTKVGWARPESTFRRVFTTKMIPSASEEQMRWIDDLQRMSTSAENAVTARRERDTVDVTHLLDQLQQPTLVLHSRRDQMIDFAEAPFLASRIADAKMVALDSDNHIVLSDETAWSVFVEEVATFLEAEPVVHRPSASVALSPRERDVLRFAALGYDNQRIADELCLSVRTVERHFHNVYNKLGVQGRSARAAAVATFLTVDTRSPTVAS